MLVRFAMRLEVGLVLASFVAAAITVRGVLVIELLYVVNC